MKMTLPNAYRFMLGGKAEVTILSNDTGKQFTFKITQKTPLPGVWYVYSGKQYIGFLRGDLFIKEKESAGPAQSAFAYAWKGIVTGQLPQSYHILHTGKCAACSRKLTDAHSIESGFGPECRKRLGVSTAAELEAM